MPSTQGLQVVLESWTVVQIDANQPTQVSAGWAYAARYSRTEAPSAGLHQETIASWERM